MGFSVVQFFANDTYEYVRRDVSEQEAVDIVLHHYTNNVATFLGLVDRVIITDDEDYTVFEWKRGEGVTYPPECKRPWPPEATT